MTLEEAIKHAEEVAESCQLKAYDIERNDYRDLEECANEHRQLAEWLKELKAVHDEIDDAAEGDMISRRKVIDIVEFECGEWSGLARTIVKAIKQLSSVQSEPSTEIQEILNYLDTTLHPIVSPDNWNVYAELHDMVSKLPSAQQPEIIRCKDCENIWYSGTATIKGVSTKIYKCGWWDNRVVSEKGFCFMAERRTND